MCARRRRGRWRSRRSWKRERLPSLERPREGSSRTGALARTGKAHSLAVSVGQHSDRGRKDTNQDFHGLVIPGEPLLSSKGIAVAIADGISSSTVSHVAAESAVASFLSDYYCTSETWSVKTSAQRVLAATNAWLHAETRRSAYAYERDKGYVCTFSALVLKAATAHLFHVGDARIYRLAGHDLEQLTQDHRVVVSADQSYLGRALGTDQHVEIDYRTVALAQGQHFILATDGVYEHIGRQALIDAIRDHADLDTAARVIVEAALAGGSQDNLTVQILRVDAVPSSRTGSPDDVVVDLPPAPLLAARTDFDGFRIVRELHGSARSHIYLAIDRDSGDQVALKVPSIDLRGDALYLRRLATEEWIARRIDSPHVLKPFPIERPRTALYVAFEHVEGCTLTQWMRDNPQPDLEAVRRIVDQVAQGLRAFHRKEMVHQDLRPDNVMIDAAGTARIIDFGSTRVAGLAERSPRATNEEVLGTEQYSAPEYLLGEGTSAVSDLYSLGVIAYQMISGRLPYGLSVARTKSQQRRLVYRSVLHRDRAIPAWIDGTLRRAVHPDPLKRYQALSEFLHDLRHPNRATLDAARGALMERNPLLFWKSVSLALLCLVLVLLFILFGRPS